MASTSYIVSYDLVGTDETSTEYKRLIEGIKAYGTYAKILKSVWIIRSHDTAVSIRDYLNQFIDSNDRLFVATLTGTAAWHNCLATNEWLKGNL
jgi:hypothetical protein